jgi:hypothetical protein
MDTTTTTADDIAIGDMVTFHPFPGDNLTIDRTATDVRQDAEGKVTEFEVAGYGVDGTRYFNWFPVSAVVKVRI